MHFAAAQVRSFSVNIYTLLRLKSAPCPAARARSCWKSQWTWSLLSLGQCGGPGQDTGLTPGLALVMTPGDKLRCTLQSLISFGYKLWACIQSTEKSRHDLRSDAMKLCVKCDIFSTFSQEMELLFLVLWLTRSDNYQGCSISFPPWQPRNNRIGCEARRWDRDLDLRGNKLANTDTELLAVRFLQLWQLWQLWQC